MPGTVQQLKEKLMGAIDTEANVLNMSVLVEVIYDLEQTRVTAEELTVTRLGLLINNVRRKTFDKDLARRMKQLVKQWQQLVQNSIEQNGIPDDHKERVSGGSSMVSHSGSVDQSNDAQSNRKKILNKLSRLKKTPRITPPSQSIPSTLSSSSVPFLSNSEDIQQVTTSPHTSTDVVTSSIAATKNIDLSAMPISNGMSHDPLIIRLPLTQLPQQQTTEDEPTNLIVSIPLDAVRLSWQPYPAIPPSLIVSIKRSLLSRTVGQAQSRDQLIQKREHDFVSVDSTLYSVSPSKSITTLQCHSVQHIKSEDESMDVDSPNVFSLHIGAPSGRLKSLGPPNDCVIGIDGCQGDDGLWYSWTESIPSMNGLSVTVLPYVYIDGYEESNDLYIENISNS